MAAPQPSAAFDWSAKPSVTSPPPDTVSDRLSHPGSAAVWPAVLKLLLTAGRPSQSTATRTVLAPQAGLPASLNETLYEPAAGSASAWETAPDPEPARSSDWAPAAGAKVVRTMSTEPAVTLHAPTAWPARRRRLVAVAGFSNPGFATRLRPFTVTLTVASAEHTSGLAVSHTR